MNLYCAIFIYGDCGQVMTDNWATKHQGQMRGSPSYNRTCHKYHDEYHYAAGISSAGWDKNSLLNISSQFQKYFIQLTAEELEMVAHKPGDMVMWCYKSRLPGQEMCDKFEQTGGTLVYSPNRGVCYAINLHGQSLGQSFSDDVSIGHVWFQVSTFHRVQCTFKN